MKSQLSPFTFLRARALAVLACGLISIPAAIAQTDFYAASSKANNNDRWNNADAPRKWTSDGKTWVGAKTGNVYHTNGYQIKAGNIGTSGGAKPVSSSFNGAKLIIDGFSSTSGVSAEGAGDGEIVFDLKSGGAVGPRAGGSKNATLGGYRADIVTAVTLGAEKRTLRAAVGVAVLDGTLTLNGNTRFTTGSLNDMRFIIRSAVTGSGNIEINGGSSGSKIANGFLTWEFKNLSGWRGTSIAVANKHTISFSSPTDFAQINPAASLSFSSAATGFINLSADVSVASGKFSFGDHVLEDGVYTADQLNELHVSKWNGSKDYPFASGKSRLFVGRSISAP
ncbi:hypothetical protein CMV30_18670 [Nibricoccus aquaticus]|uniref:Uncharacterized protein n=1 Tax=Nibricoccus aquaticus TaxID=2576891 RepID=A0A290QAW4_9BACT|nr:hypothetical protein [Nibricoccus aquaticus]ATC65809.1 hypothetical protein CMV30_18670 [Nibricoccus aquaticus]